LRGLTGGEINVRKLILSWIGCGVGRVIAAKLWAELAPRCRWVLAQSGLVAELLKSAPGLPAAPPKRECATATW